MQCQKWHTSFIVPIEPAEESLKSCCALALAAGSRVELQLTTCAVFKGVIVHVGSDFLMLHTASGDVVIPLAHITTQRILEPAK